MIKIKILNEIFRHIEMLLGSKPSSEHQTAKKPRAEYTTLVKFQLFLSKKVPLRFIHFNIIFQ